MKKLLRINKTIGLMVVLAAVFNSCGKDEPKRDFIARVESSYLTKEDVAADLDTNNLQSSHKNEYIRNWIDQEVLYQEAVSENILDDQEYQRVLNKSKKELAVALLTKKIFEDNEIEYNLQDLIDFYGLKKNEFKVFRDSYLYNIIGFNDEDKAVLFRSILLESDWNKASKVFRDDPSIFMEKTNIFAAGYEIQPLDLKNVVSELLPGEVSIILNLEPSSYFIVQLNKQYRHDEIPAFDEIKNLVEDRFVILKKREFMKQYMADLYSKFKIEIKQKNQ